MTHRYVRLSALVLAGLAAFWFVQARELRFKRSPFQLLDAEKGGATKVALDPGQGATFYVSVHSDTTSRDEPVSYNLRADLRETRLHTGDLDGFLNVCIGGEWAGRNIPAPDSTHYRYDIVDAPLATSFLSAEIFEAVPARVVWSSMWEDSPDCDPSSTFTVGREEFSFGGLQIPTTDAPGEADVTGLTYRVAGGDFMVLQNGHHTVETATNQSWSAAVASTLAYFDGTTSYTLPHPNVPGQGDGSLVAQLDATLQRAGAFPALYENLAGGNRDYLADNGQEHDFNWNYLVSPTLSPSSKANTTLVDQITTRNPSFTDVLECISTEGAATWVSAWDGGTQASVILGAGRSGGVPWVFHQWDPDQGTVGGSGGHSWYDFLGDPDRNGLLNLSGSDREIVFFGCGHHTGDPTMVDFDQIIVGVLDPLNHGCCVIPPGPETWFIRTGDQIVINSTGDGFPLEGHIGQRGNITATSTTNVAGFSDVTSLFEGQLVDGRILGATHTVGALDELFGQPIIYTLDLIPKSLEMSADLTVALGEVFEVLPGQDLIVQAPATLRNEGLIRNLGNITILDGARLDNFGFLSGRGNVSIQGTAINHPDGSLGCTEASNRGSGIFTNWGTFDCDVVRNEASFGCNAGSTTAIGALNNAPSGECAFGGQLSLGGCDNDGTVNNTGLAFNSGACDTSGGTVLNSGSWYDVCEGDVTGDEGSSYESAIIVVPCEFDSTLTGKYYITVDPPKGDYRARTRFDPKGGSATITVVGANFGKVGIDLDGYDTLDDDDDDLTAFELRKGTSFVFGPVVTSILPETSAIDTTSNITIHGENFGIYTEWDGPTLDLNTSEFLNGEIYFQIDTVAAPEGALRAQVGRSSYRCLSGKTWFGDQDRDGRGNASVTSSACMAPLGFVDNAADCDDSNRSIFGGASEINDGLDNQCPGDLGFGSTDELSRQLIYDASKNLVIPPQAGATNVFEIIRDVSPTFDSPSCDSITITGSNFNDPSVPAPGECQHTLARAVAPFLGEFGTSSDGQLRSGCSSEPTEPVAVDDSFIVAPGLATQGDVRTNDDVPPGSQFLLVSPPGLHADLFSWFGDGRFFIAQPTFTSVVSFSYRIVTGGLESAVATVTLIGNTAALYTFAPGDSHAVPTLVIGGLHYPVYQFVLADNPYDLCGAPHWHSDGPVYALESPTVPLAEPPVDCGFDLYRNIPQEAVDVPFTDWDAFLVLHPPTI